MKYIVEHMEPDMFEWCVLEYAHMSQTVGADNLIITNVPAKDHDKLASIAHVKEEPVQELSLSKACILDPWCDNMLSPQDNGAFNYMVFGGILGNNPAQKRTSKLTDVLPFEKRLLGKDQLSTDTAVYVTKKILEGTNFEDIRFVSEVEIERDEGESVILPFKYVVEGGRLVISEDLVEYVKKHGFD